MPFDTTPPAGVECATLADLYALGAMMALLMAHERPCHPADQQQIAAWAFAQADAMLAEREAALGLVGRPA
jgi:hypothetical protein